MKRSIAIVALLLASCGDDDATSARDAGTTGDAGDDDASMRELEWPELSVGQTVDPDDPRRIGDDAQPADYSCLGLWDLPAPGPSMPLDLVFWRNLTPFETVADLCFRTYADTTVGGPNDACASGDPRTNAAGEATIEVPGDAPFSIRVFPMAAMPASDSLVPFLMPDLRASRAPVPGLSRAGALILPAMSEAYYAILPLLDGHDRLPGTGIVGVSARDCMARTVHGARLRIAQLDGSYVDPGPRSSDVAYGYTDGSGMLTATQPWTHVRGVGAAMNIPVRDDHRVLVELWGRIAGESAPRVVACAEAPVEADTVTTVIHLDPVRRNGPICPGMR